MDLRRPRVARRSSEGVGWVSLWGFLWWAVQGFRKSFLAWGLKFKQFSAGINFEIIGHSYKDLINKNTHVQHMHISIEIMIIKPERNDEYETWCTEKKFCDVFFFQIKIYFLQHLTSIRCFQHDFPLLLGNKGSMQGQQSRQCTQWSPCDTNAG